MSTSCPGGSSALPIINVYHAAAAYVKLFPEEFWQASHIMSPSKSGYVTGVRPKRWGKLVVELVYAPIGIDGALCAVVGGGSEKWHQHLDDHGRALVHDQCMAVVAAVNAGTTLRRLRAHFARQSTPSAISLPLNCQSFVPRHQVRII